VVLVVSRRPDVLFHAQFWAEDGKFWYADAYNLGAIAPFLHPAAGYFQTLPRLAALFAQLFPMAVAPLALNLVGIVVQVLPVQYLLSSRCRELGSFAGRCLFAFLYLGLPNSHEMHVDITNAYWRLALLAMLILFSQPGRTILWNIFDFGVLALCGLTGPLIIFIAPIAGVLYLWEKRTRWRLSLLIVCGVGAGIEVLSVWVAGGSERVVNAIRGASPELFFQILAKQVFLAVLVGRRTVVDYSFDSRWGLILAVVVVMVGISIELYALFKAPLPWKAVILFSTCTLAGGMAYPMMFSPQWPGLLQSGGVRYWFFSLLAFIASMVWMLHERNPAVVRRIAMALLVVTLYGVIQDWGHPRLIDLHFETYAQSFAEMPAGTRFRIPLNPAGWFMVLMKH
jgi:uncharacterized MnhB-related membrane protein